MAVGGSWLTPLADLRAGQWNAITDRARRALAVVGK
jgi:2-keto-3-deoxy-6-phosphogluconate aldolase